MSKEQADNHNEEKALYLRNFIFGVEDSLVSTVGMISGVAIAGTSRPTILLAGVVLIFVEAFSMGVGSFLSEQSSEGYIKKDEPSAMRSVWAGIIMLVSYFFAGFIPLAPYVFFSVSFAFWVSIILSIITLFILGVISAKLSHIGVAKQGMKMAIIGGVAIALGILVGTLTSGYLA